MSFCKAYQVPRAACLALIVALTGNLSGADPQAGSATNGPATGQRRGPFGGAINQNQRPMPKAEWLDPDHGTPNGTQYKTFPSKVLGHEVSCLVYLPPDYEKQTQRYPVIYWLHGMGGSQRAGAVGFVPHLETAIKAGHMPPTIVVLVNGMVKSFYCDSTDGRVPMESVIIKDLIPHVDQTYRTIARREGRVIQGYSMGGFGAAHLGFKYPDLFGTVVIDAGALIDTDSGSPPPAGPLHDVFGDDLARRRADNPKQLARKNAELLRRTNVRIGCGSLDNLLPRNEELHKLLQELGVEHQFEIVPEVAHNAILYYKKLGPQGFEFHHKALAGLNK